MIFSKMFSHDVDCGIRRKWMFFLVLAAAVLVFCREYYGIIYTSLFNGETDQRATWMNYLIFLFQGMEEYIPSPDNPFVFPAMWILIFLYAAYKVLGYPFDDLTAYGQQILVRSGGRKGWWFSKCLWNVCSAFLYFIIIDLVVAAFCICEGVPLTADFSGELAGILLKTSAPLQESEVVFYTLLLPPLVSAAINMLQMFLGLFLKPMLSFCVTSGLLILSAYFKSALAIGNYAMILRSSIVLEDGVQIGTGTILLIAIILFSALGGEYYFRRHDILPQG